MFMLRSGYTQTVNRHYFAQLLEIQFHLTLKMTTAQVAETSVTVNNNSPIQDYVHPDDQTQPTFEMTPGFKPFTVKPLLCKLVFVTRLKVPNIVSPNYCKSGLY